MAFDTRCLDLAHFFLEGRVPEDVLDAMAEDLAQHIQTAIEDFDDGSAAVAVKRALLKTKPKREG